MGCGIYWAQVNELDRAMGVMDRYGIDPGSDAYQSLWGQRGRLMTQIGQKFPRETLQMRLIKALYSPMIRLWHDIESGWMVEAREKPGAPPVYKSVGDEVAMAILKGEVTHELEEELARPDEYLGE
ncbi:hypothetical protein ES703_97191 [subsurface metagenome]